MTILVTGAGGGLGRALCRTLRSRSGAPVKAVDRLGNGKEEIDACDVTDPAAVEVLVARVRPSLVYHLAGSFSNDYSIDYPANALGARYLMESAARHVPGARIVLMGSAAEYGDVRPGENPVPEDRVLRPVTIYGLTKSIQTHFASHFARSRGSDVVVARLFNLFAPGLSERLFVGRVERLIARYLRGEVATIDVGSLDGVRDYVGLEEALGQIEMIAARGKAGEIYHVASGVGITMRELLRRMLEAACVPPGAVREVAPASVGRTGFDVPQIWADVSRTRALAAEAA